MDFEYKPTEDKTKPDHIIKLITLGDDSVCIKELINKYIGREESESKNNEHLSINMDSQNKIIEIKGKKIK